MFNRLRHVTRVLSTPKTSPFHEPDIAFEEENIPEVTEVSKIIAVSIEVFLVTLVFGVVGAAVVRRVFPLTKVADITTLTAVIVSVLVFVYDHVVGRIQRGIGARLKIHEKVAPYFGRRITRTLRIIRG